MTDLERRDVQYLLDALKRTEWAGEGQTCPVCRRLKRYGATHSCSCSIAIGLVKVKPRLLGSEPLPSVREMPAKDEMLALGAKHLEWLDDVNYGDAHSGEWSISSLFELVYRARDLLREQAELLDRATFGRLDIETYETSPKEGE
jgi:hypothetical protein